MMTDSVLEFMEMIHYDLKNNDIANCASQMTAYPDEAFFIVFIVRISFHPDDSYRSTRRSRNRRSIVGVVQHHLQYPG
jgi:Na+-transporting NADH:ubiquinone oxidoreductase subunit NqrF